MPSDSSGSAAALPIGWNGRIASAGTARRGACATEPEPATERLSSSSASRPKRRIGTCFPAGTWAAGAAAGAGGGPGSAIGATKR